ncbi:hypothetical protein NA56DRAFT_435063 [Hyaloscypha hepaticicola]|uniref:DUF676 domain-containing protein n=1 Tax=Hyaloscypha hepaticicola TaxID=2082293 RepID=A0A2J6QGM2_9HELO|nr:hypothetical protein NA56DRAFT_435063 [Hyaloscypha hepaticicola]
MARQEFKVTDEPFLDPGYSPSNPNIDFVFVHGLNPRGRRNHAYETWTYAEGRAPWPYELLPQDFPNARIWIFGYNSNVTSGGSGANISDHANSLLNVLQRMREESPEDPSRIPIIFLGHSLGGLVIKQALLNAKENPRFNPTWDASFGLVFFGTPHRGGNTGALEELAVRLAKTFATDTMDNDLMMCLKPNSLFTLEAAARFSRQLNKFKILTFFETRPTNFYGLSKI